MSDEKELTTAQGVGLTIAGAVLVALTVAFLGVLLTAGWITVTFALSGAVSGWTKAALIVAGGYPFYLVLVGAVKGIFRAGKDSGK